MCFLWYRVNCNSRQYRCYLKSIGQTGDVIRVFNCCMEKPVVHKVPHRKNELWNITVVIKTTTKFQQLQNTIWTQIKAPPNRWNHNDIAINFDKIYRPFWGNACIVIDLLHSTGSLSKYFWLSPLASTATPWSTIWTPPFAFIFSEQLLVIACHWPIPCS